MRVADICNADVVTIDRGGSVRAAARLMREHHVGDVVVVQERDGKRVPCGILTDRDIVVELIATGTDLDTVDVGDVMSFDLLALAADASIDDAIEQMRTKAVRRAPVVDASGALAGLVSLDDVIGALASRFARVYALLVREREREVGVRG